MKTDDEFVRAWADGHAGVEATAAVLRALGLDVAVTPSTLRGDVSEAEGWLHDIDLYIDGQAYQHKQNKRYAFGERPWSIVDERVKADRTPVHAYIITFTCGSRMVTPYAPHTWVVQLYEDRFDRAWKEFYICPRRAFRSVDEWFFGQGAFF